MIFKTPRITVYYVLEYLNYRDITSMVTDITWSGDINTLPRTLEINVQNTTDPSKGRLIDFQMGKALVLHLDGVEVFSGYIFKGSIDSAGKQTLTAYDQLIYLTKNAETMLIKDKSASDIIISLLNKSNIPVKYIEPTGYKISKLACQAQTLADIFNNCLEETTNNTGKSYLLRSAVGEVSMYSRTNAALLSISVPDIVSGNYEISIEETRNQVKVEKGQIDGEDAENPYTSTVVSDSGSIGSYGLMQHVESANDDDTLSTMKSKAEKLLEQLKNPQETFSIDFVGHPSAITGNLIEIYNTTAKLSGKYYITSDSHSFSSGSYKMSLQLSTKIE